MTRLEPQDTHNYIQLNNNSKQVHTCVARRRVSHKTNNYVGLRRFVDEFYQCVSTR